MAKLRHTKNGMGRLVPLSGLALLVLENLSKDNSRVFSTTDYAIRHGWDRLKVRAGIEDLKFHDLRHEAISSFFEIGLNIAEVGKISGHKDARMLFRYTHPNESSILEKLAK